MEALFDVLKGLNVKDELEAERVKAVASADIELALKLHPVDKREKQFGGC